jgi:diguanylate cyclase (GGDEF)-like protein
VNTPFENESWYLIGMMREDHLLSYINKIKSILKISILASILMAIFGGIVISYFFTKPIARLAKRVRDREHDKSVELRATGFTEIDGLLDTIESANVRLTESAVRLSKIIDLTDFPIGAFEIRDDSDRIFVTEQFQTILELDDHSLNRMIQKKDLFTEYLSHLMKSPVKDEDYVYKMDLDHDKYIRIKIVEEDQSTIGVIVVVSDEILGKNLIKEERDYDPLTKLLNRRAVQLEIEKTLAQADPKKITALIMFDLDNLKIINDSFGHKWGDSYIKSAAAALSGIGNSSHILGRRSGDEFVLLLHGFSSRDAILTAMNDFYASLDQHQITYPDGSLKALSISGGLLWVDRVSLDYEELLHQADQLLYAAKNNKKGFYIEGHIDHQVELLSIRDSLTGLYNQAFLKELLDKEIARSKRDKRYLTIFMVDVDLFQLFNERSGMHQGDTCLIEIASVLNASVNRPNDIIARYGDDEYCMVLPGVLPDGALKIGHTIIEAVENKKIPHESSPLGVVSLSLGFVSLIPTGDHDSLELILKAEQALLNAKTKGLKSIQEYSISSTS